MKSSRWLFPVAVPALAVALASCGTMKDLSSATTEGLGKMGEGIGKGFDRVAEVATDPFGPKIAVVEAREDDLRETPSGHDQALAFERRRRGFFDLFRGPVDFTEPELPDDDGFADGSLLPPALE